MEKAVYLKIAEHYFNSFETECMALLFFIISDYEFIFGEKFKAHRGGGANWLNGESLNPLEKFTLVKKEHNKLKILLLVCLPRLSSDKKVEEWPFLNLSVVILHMLGDLNIFFAGSHVYRMELITLFDRRFYHEVNSEIMNEELV